MKIYLPICFPNWNKICTIANLMRLRQLHLCRGLQSWCKSIFSSCGTFIIYIPGARGIRQNITLRGACPEGNIIAEGNILPNPPSGGSINDILYRKICHRKNSTTWTLWLNYYFFTCETLHIPHCLRKCFQGIFCCFRGVF